MKAFTLQALVVRGNGLGRKLGFPTANLKVSPLKMPPFGVYRVAVSGAGLEERPAVCSVGVRPTLAGVRRAQAEVHIPEFAGNLYGRRLEVVFLEKLRAEKKFASLGALKAQIRRDIRKALLKVSAKARIPS